MRASSGSLTRSVAVKIDYRLLMQGKPGSHISKDRTMTLTAILATWWGKAIAAAMITACIEGVLRLFGSSLWSIVLWARRRWRKHREAKQQQRRREQLSPIKEPFVVDIPEASTVTA